MKFTEAKLEQAIIELLGEQGYNYLAGEKLTRADKTQVLIEADLRAYLASRYQPDGLTSAEISRIIRQLATLSANDLYDSNKTFSNWLANGFLLKRDDRNQKDLYIELIDTRYLPQALAMLFMPEPDELAAVAEPNAAYLPTDH